MCYKIFALTSTLIFLSNTTHSQIISPLPNIDTLYNAIDTFYNNFTNAAVQEFSLQSKGRWLNYLPSPGYSPFTGGFSFSLNLSAPVQEIKFRQQTKQKIASIKLLSTLQAAQLKMEVYADYKALQIAIFEFHSRDSLEYLKLKAFNLFKSQYQRNELTPSDFLSKQMEMESFKASRIVEINSINKSLLTLFIKAKCAIGTNDSAF